MLNATHNTAPSGWVFIAMRFVYTPEPPCTSISPTCACLSISPNPQPDSGRQACVSVAGRRERADQGAGRPVDTRLLYRDSRGVEITPAGERLLHHARLIMRQVDYLKSEFTQYGVDSAGHIRIFANTTAVTEFLPEVLAGFCPSARA